VWGSARAKILDVTRLKELERENSIPKRMYADYPRFVSKSLPHIIVLTTIFQAKSNAMGQFVMSLWAFMKKRKKFGCCRF
jgi:hypothetical protein